MPDQQATNQQSANVYDKLRHIFDDQIPLALIAADVDRIQSYVFESAKLAEMRGASLILDLLNVKTSDDSDIWGDLEIDGRRVKGICQVLVDEFELKPECVIYAAGGAILFVAPLQKAEAIKQRIEGLFLETTLTATITVVWEAIRLDDLEAGIRPSHLADWFSTKAGNATGEAWRLLKHNLVEVSDWKRCDNPASITEADYFSRKGFREVYAALQNKLRQAKQSRLSVPIFEVSSFTERCSYCHFRPACQLAPEINGRSICQACFRKRQDHDGRAAHSFHLRKFWDYLQQQAGCGNILPYREGLRNDTDIANWTDVESPPDLEAIARAGSGRVGNFIGIIYADGNNMGGEIDRLVTVEDFKRFADEVRTAIEEGVFSGLGTLFDRPRKSEVESQDRKGKKRTREIRHHPFEIVSTGGDDVYLFVPADIALQMAHHLCAEFERRLRHRNLTLAAGVLIAHVSMPVYFSRQIVKGLLKNAKRLSKAANPPISAIDFQVITADTAISEDIQAFRKQAYHNRFSEGLTTRPLTLDHLNNMITLVRNLKQDKFPKSQLYALREAIVRGPQQRTTNFYYYQQARSDEMKRRYAPLHKFLNRGKTDELLPFWKTDDGDTNKGSRLRKAAGRASRTCQGKL
ncbi:MAG: Cas10/Cmr2 second palm domain-containing protein [Blastocatellia bacterium]